MASINTTTNKWWKPVLLGGLITASIAVIAFAYSSITRAADIKASDAVKMERSRSIDSLQWVAIRANDESNGNTNKRVDKVEEKLNIMDRKIDIIVYQLTGQRPETEN